MKLVHSTLSNLLFWILLNVRIWSSVLPRILVVSLGGYTIPGRTLGNAADSSSTAFWFVYTVRCILRTNSQTHTSISKVRSENPLALFWHIFLWIYFRTVRIQVDTPTCLPSQINLPSSTCVPKVQKWIHEVIGATEDVMGVFWMRKELGFFCPCPYYALGSEHGRPVDGDDKLGLATLSIIPSDAAVVCQWEDFCVGLPVSASLCMIYRSYAVCTVCRGGENPQGITF